MRTFTATADEHPQPEPLVPWWSFGKTVLAAAALKLVEERRLSLDASIADAPYTLRHLLRHTSGLRDYGQFPEYHAAVAAHGTPWSVDEMLQRAHASSPLFPVGARFSYSNIGYLFVRQMVERAADADLDTALRRLVFDPLGIESAFVASTVADFDRIAWDTARGYDPRWVYMGCVVGSLSWAATLMHRLIHGDLLAPETKAAMFEPFPYDADAAARHDLGYGLGVMCEPAAAAALSGMPDRDPAARSSSFHFSIAGDPRRSPPQWTSTSRTGSSH